MLPFHFTRSVRSLNRLRHIAQVLTQHGFGYIVTRIDLGRFVPVWMLRRKRAAKPIDEPPASIGRRLAAVCAQLGPTFIKLGQQLSTRPDILPLEVLAELRSLQDDVPPFDTTEARTIIAAQLGRSIDECFASFEDSPFASGSIGQVYRARTIEGKDVVVKVRRPDIDDTIKLDMQLLKWLADSLERLIPDLRAYRPAMLVAELEETLLRELDYINEASSTARFAKAFADDPGIRIPKVFWQLSSQRVLTLQALEGQNLDRLLDGTDNGIDRRLIARRLTDCYLTQVFELGMFHADPHPGNILIKPEASIGLIDFGQVGTISDEWMTELIVIVYACIAREIDVVMDALADMGTLTEQTDRRMLGRSLQMLIDKYDGLPLKRFDLTVLVDEFSDVVRRHDVIIPRDLVLLFKALATVVSVTTKLDPDLDVLELLKPRLKRSLADRLAPSRMARSASVMGWHMTSILRRAPGQLRQALRRLGTGTWQLNIRHENIDRLVSELDRSSNRLAFSIVIAAIIIGSSVVVSADTEQTLFGMRVQDLGIGGYLIAGVLGLALAWAIYRSGRLH